MTDNEAAPNFKYKYKINRLELRLSGALEFRLFDAIEYYFDHEAETFEELNDELPSVIGTCAQSLWFEDYKEVEQWVSAYGLAKAMRESEISFDNVLRRFQKEGDSYSMAHDEQIYVQLLETIIRVNDLVSVVEIDENIRKEKEADAEELAASLEKLSARVKEFKEAKKAEEAKKAKKVKKVKKVIVKKAEEAKETKKAASSEDWEIDVPDDKVENVMKMFEKMAAGGAPVFFNKDFKP